MRSIRFLLAATLLALPLAAARPAVTTEQEVAGRLIGAALVGRGAHEKLAWLCDRIGPRLSGSRGLEEAVAWSLREMERDGAERAWTEKVLVPHWVRGAEEARILAPAEHPIAVTALGGSVPTPEEGITAEVVEAAGFEDLRAAGEAARGKIVLLNRPIQAGGGAWNGYGSAVGLRTRGAVEAARLGAAAMILRSLGTASYRLPHTGAMGYEEGVPKIPAAAIAAEDADLIHRLLASGEAVRIRLRLGCRSLPDAESANVIAEIRGRERPEEIVLIGAHLDSWDVGMGAIDDGAGVAVVMETMRVLRAEGVRPRRTIRAVLFTNEENGLRGGRGYAQAHKDEIPRHVAAIESDSGGARPLGFGVSAGPGGAEAVREIARLLEPIGAGQVTPGGGGADIGPLAAGGVPLLSLRQDGERYFDYHHSPADTLDKVEPGDLALNVAAMAVMAYGLAERPDPLPRQPPRGPLDGLTTIPNIW